MSLSFFIAKRLYSTKDNSGRISSLGVNLASVGVMIGLAVMIVAVAIVLGFKAEISNKVIGFGSHIQILNSDAAQSPDAYPVVATPELKKKILNCKGVTHLQCVSQKTGILKTDEEFKGTIFKGVGADFDTAFIASHIVEGYLPNFAADSTKEHIVISQQMASELSVKSGDKIFAYFFEGEVKMRRYIIKGIYETNMSQFDNSIVIANQKSINKLNNWNDQDASVIEITISDFAQLDSIADNIACVTPTKPDVNGCYYAVYTITELYGAIFDWLKLLDMNIWVILILMTCVCCFTMISGLLILILEKTSTIGVLKAMGARNGLVQRVFIHYGIFIIGRGLVLGNALGLLLCYVQWQWHLLSLDAASYYVDHVPVLFNWYVILGLNISTLIICALILISPTLIISHVKPVKALKFD